MAIVMLVVNEEVRKEKSGKLISDLTKKGVFVEGLFLEV